jgi:protein-S-isoprenylcysteine O-methyltransferase Ste14
MPLMPFSPHPLVLALHRLQIFLSREFLGGPKLLRLSWVINAQKGGTLLFVLGLMWFFDAWHPTMWTYLALHGTYGVCWLLKHAVFPDTRWDVPVTFGGAFMSFALTLGLYWVAPSLIAAGFTRPAAPAMIAVCIALHTLGLALMFGSDAQKYFTLRLRPGLITDGFFARIRHPNYLGEMLIYASYAVLAGHWVPWLILAWVWLGVFLPNILLKEASLSRHPGWVDYRRRSGLLWPR